MKKITLLFILLLICSNLTFAQWDKYTVSGGVLGGANYSTFQNDNIDFEWKFGWDAGAWVNVPIGSVFSIEPQIMYSSRKYIADGYEGTQPESTHGYVSIPIFAKASFGRIFSVFAGPEFNILTDVKDDNNNFEDIDAYWKKHSTALSGGLEIAPHSRFTIYARYNHGLVDMLRFDDGNPFAPNEKLKNQSVHLGLKIKLFGTTRTEKYVAAETKPAPTPKPVVVDKDTDGDGILDKNDNCPSVAGVAKYKGCPIPDTDKDGINDEEDACVTVAGIAKYKGCPIPDTDNDGINDEEDLCPKTPGIAANYGCPEITLYYKKADAKLNAQDKADLDKVATFLNNHPDIRVSLEGHTSSIGKEDYNMGLSKRRVEMAVEYLVSKGISKDRLQTQWFGETRLFVSPDPTEAERAKNRRVEVKVLK